MPGKSLQGFTIIELLIAITLIALLAGFLIPQLGRFDQYQRLNDEAVNLQTALRAAQNNALSGVKCDSATLASEWFLEFPDPTTYHLKAACGAAVSTFSTVKLNGVVIQAIKAQSTGEVIPDLQIVFSNISSDISFRRLSQDPIDFSGVVITMMPESGASAINTVVEKGGAIYIRSN